MGFCCVPGCANSSRNSKTSFHAFPLKNEKILAQWIHNIKRKDFTPNKHSKVCGEHFKDDCFIPDMSEKCPSIEPSRYKYLRADAVPSIFTHRAEKAPRINTLSRIQRQEAKELIDSLIEPSHSAVNNSDLGGTNSFKQSKKGIKRQKNPKAKCVTPNKTTNPVKYGTPKRVKLDHAYHQSIFKDTAMYKDASTQTTLEDITPRENVTNASSEIPQYTHVSIPTSIEHSITTHTQKAEANASSDPEYTPPQFFESGSDSDYVPDNSDEHCDKPLQFENSYFIIAGKCLNELFKFCGKCGSSVVKIKNYRTGSMLSYSVRCTNQCHYIWRSQAMQHRSPVGNLLLVSACESTGLTYERLRAFSSAMSLELLSHTAYKQIRKEHVYPVIQHVYLREQSKILNSLDSSQPLIVAGDGRCDSPGHNAKYGTYTIMQSGAGGNKILESQVVRCDEVKNSNAMEPEGLQRALDSLKSKQIKINVLATDRHVTVAKIMREKYSDISHEFDIWHVAKNIVKKLTEKAKTKKHEALLPWIQSISNHFWWCCSECKGDEQLLKEMWLSLLNHICGKHEWTGCIKFHRCAHYLRSEEEENEIQYIDMESETYQILKSIVMDKSLLKSFAHLTKFCHTGELEVFHSMLLKYVPKRQHFSHAGMKARTMLAILDWNNRERHQKTKDGAPIMDAIRSKRRKSWVMRKRYSAGNADAFRVDILDLVLFVHENKIYLPPIECPENVAKNAKPSKNEMLSAYTSRFK